MKSAQRFLILVILYTSIFLKKQYNFKSNGLDFNLPK